jgi:release factor glutamine methyltransferase
VTETIGALIAQGAAALKQAGIESPMREARLLLGQAAGLGLSTLIGWPEREAPAEAAEAFRSFIARRLEHEPVSRILGRREFWSLDFAVTAATLDPRPDTETLVEAVLAQLPDRQAPLRLADFGTGTGCILLALLSELPNAYGIGIDRSAQAALVAAGNAAALGLAGRAGFVVGDWAESIASGLDVVVSNPPYIASAQIDRLDAEVAAYDPPSALDGGADGLDAYRRLAPEFARLIRPDGLAAFEIGQGQDPDVAALCAAAGLQVIEIRPDLAGIGRVVLARRQDRLK